MKIALILNDNHSMWHFRRGLIKELVARRYDVTVIVPPGKFTGNLEKLGVKVIPIKINRFISISSDILLSRQLYKIFCQGQFDIVHNMTIKPNIFGTFAAKLAGIKKVVCLVSGRGHLFSEKEGFVPRLIQYIGKKLYSIALHIADGTWFQNRDDLDFFVQSGIIRSDKAVLIKSGGINTDEYSPSAVSKEKIHQLRKELDIPENSKCVVMVAARMIWSKGVKEYLESARNLKSYYPDWSFVMLCPKDEADADTVPSEFIEEIQSENIRIVDYFRDDAKTFTAMADVLVLPSYYLEGVPRSLLEGLAMAKVIVTTDNQGCKEVVRDGVNGYCVPIKSTLLLTNSLQKLFNSDRDLLREFGQQSRKIALEEFSEKFVVGRIVTNLYNLPTSLKGV